MSLPQTIIAYSIIPTIYSSQYCLTMFGEIVILKICIWPPSWTKKNFLLLILMSIAFVSSGQLKSFESKIKNPKMLLYILVTWTFPQNKTILLTCLLLQKKIVVTFANSLHFLWFYNTVIYKSTLFQILQVQRSKGQPGHLKVTTQANSSQNPKSCKWRYLVNSFIAAPAFDS